MAVKPVEEKEFKPVVETAMESRTAEEKREHIAEEYGESTVEGVVEAFKIYWRSYPVVHHQVLKIREEESHLGKDIGEGLSAKDKSSSSSSSSSSAAFLYLRSQMDALFYSRPMLPSSPLGNKSIIRPLQ